MELMDWKKLYESEQFQKEYECPKEKFGAIYHKEYTTFRLWAPNAQRVILHLYQTGMEGEEIQNISGYGKLVQKYGSLIRLEAKEKGIFEKTLDGDFHGIYYTYEIVRSHNGCVHSIETVDPYAVSTGANGFRGMVVDMEKTNPKGWGEDASFCNSAKEAIIYELHVKDFSNDPQSGITEKYRGKYLAFTQRGTTVGSEGLFTSGIDYLKELGITHVHLLPTYDFGSIDELNGENQFNWGYDPVNYRVPEGSYSTNPKNGEVRISEFKQMVKALHEAGIGVVLDMVFNHTFSLDSPLQRCVPYYYYRQKEDGTLANGSGCGNETASERAMFRSYMIDTCLFWAKEYHIDGFRFDLMGVHDHETMNQIRKALDGLPKGKNILLYGEPWAAEPVVIKEPLVPADKAHIRSLAEHVAIFHDGTRDAIKGSVFEAREGGFVNGATKDVSEEMKHSIVAWTDELKLDTPRSPKQVISYVSAHDNYTLWDKLILTMDEATDFVHGTEVVKQANRLIAAMIQMSLGTPFFQAGEEFLRTKLGDDNSYCSSAELNQLDWKRRVTHSAMVDYYKGLIALRKRCRVFNRIDQHTAEVFQFDRIEASLVSFYITKPDSAEWSQLYIVYNAGETGRGIPIPKGSWQLLVDGECSTYYENEQRILKDSVIVKGHSALILGKCKEDLENPSGKGYEKTKQIMKGVVTMDLFSKVSEKIVDAGKYASEVVKDTSEVITLKNQIKNLMKSNQCLYEEIGRTVAQQEEGREDSQFADLLQIIKRNQQEAARLQQRVDLMKDTKRV